MSHIIDLVVQKAYATTLDATSVGDLAETAGSDIGEMIYEAVLELLPYFAGLVGLFFLIRLVRRWMGSSRR